jgi:hypothetical protein
MDVKERVEAQEQDRRVLAGDTIDLFLRQNAWSGQTTTIDPYYR